MLRRTSTHRVLITFVRHSESTNNVLRAEIGADKRNFDLQRSSDPGLTDRGIQQAHRVATRLVAEEGNRASVILTSYFNRALQTAAVIEDAVKQQVPESRIRVVVDRDFHEIGGSYECKLAPGFSGAAEDGALRVVGTRGRTCEDVCAAYPTFSCVAGQGCEDGWYHGATKETVTEAKARAMTLWGRIADVSHAIEASTAADADEPSLIVVTHGHLYSLMMNEAKLAGLFVGKTPEQFTRLTNTAITRLRLVQKAHHHGSGWSSMMGGTTTHQQHQTAPPATIEGPATAVRRSASAAASGAIIKASPATNAHCTRAASVLATPPTILPTRAGVELEVILDNCNAHVKDLGSLISAALPLSD